MASKIPKKSVYYLMTLLTGVYLLGFGVHLYVEAKSNALAASTTAAAVSINKSSSASSVQTGEEFIYNIQYSCVGLTDNCEGTVITDPLPPELEYIGLVGSIHTISEVYNSPTNTVTFSLIDPLSAGSSGQVQVRVRFPNGITPNGTLASNTATISASNAISASSTFDVSANASSKPNAAKEFVSGGAAGSYTTYQTKFCNDFYSVENGTLTLTDVVIVDTLPIGAVFVQTNPENGTGASYDPIDNVVTFTKDSIAPGDCIYPKVTITYPSPLFNVGDIVGNTAHFMYTPIGEPRDTFVSTQDIQLTVQTSLALMVKTNSHSSLFPGQGGTYRIDGDINGTEPIEEFCINDTIPVGVEVTQFDVGGWYYGGLIENRDRVNVYYTTNLNGATLVPGSPFSIWDPGTFINAENDLGLVPGTEYITSINWCFGDVPAGFASYDEIQIQYLLMNSATAGIVTNCAEMSSTTIGAGLLDDCVDLEILGLTPGVNLNPIKSVVPGGTLNKGI